MSKTKTYCVPWNTGLASETGAVCRRLSRLLTGLDVEINSMIVQGTICDDIRAFRMQVMERLEAEGWSMSYDGGDKLKVRPPGHKKPFERRFKAEA